MPFLPASPTLKWFDISVRAMTSKGLILDLNPVSIKDLQGQQIKGYLDKNKGTLISSRLKSLRCSNLFSEFEQLFFILFLKYIS